MPDEQGLAPIEKWRRFEAKTGKRHADLDGPEVAHELIYLHRWWRELRSAASAGMNGPNPISYLELDAWARTTRRDPSAAEVEAIRRMDNAYMVMVCEEQAKRRRDAT